MNYPLPTNKVNWVARWIWPAGEADPTKGRWVLARKRLDLAAAPGRPRLHITADSRYVLWVNGERLGYGPVRSYPEARHYDTYDLAGRLVAGANEIRVLVLHYGVGTFQYLPGPGGLLAQLEWEEDGRTFRAGSDHTWEMADHPGYDTRVPRITCQQGWVEHFDARFPEPAWGQPQVRGPLGETLVPRPVPFLTEEPVYPIRVLETRLVQPPAAVWGVDLRPNFLPGYLRANPKELPGFLATLVHIDSPCIAIFEAQSHVKGCLRVNGRDPRPLTPTNRFAVGWRVEADLQAGDNLILIDLAGLYFDWSASYAVEAPVPLTPRDPLGGGARFVTLGPMPDAGTHQAIWDARGAADLVPYAPLAWPVRMEDELNAHVFDLVTLAQPVPGSVHAQGLDLLCTGGREGATIYPAHGGEDVELLFDFGRMTVGWLEFEVEAEAGVIMDWCGFESIQEGVRDYPWEANVVLRYTSRGGVQRYTSVVRRGFRYLNLTLRGLRSPLKLRAVRTLLSTYPLAERGSFLCDDWALNRIWQIGAYTTRLCSEDTFVDCPTYEQTYWVGDARNESLVNLAAFGAQALSRHSLLLPAPSLASSLLVNSQVPSAWHEILPAWSFLWVLAVEEYYRWSGERPFLEEIYPAVAEQGRRCETLLGPDGLFRIGEGSNLLDWAAMDTPLDAAVTHVNAWLVEAYRRQAAMARALDRPEEVERCQVLARGLAEAINLHLWDERRQAYADCLRVESGLSPVISQQTNTVAFLCGCVPPERLPAVRRLIVDPPQGVVWAGSPFTLHFVLEALARMGEYERLLQVIRRNWGMMIERGASTCWETLPGYEPNGRWTRSHCHAWSAAPTYFLSTLQLGVTPLTPGFTRARIAPMPAGLRWAHGAVPTPHGEITVAWRIDAAGFQVDVVLPEGVAAEVVPPERPGGYREAVADGEGVTAAWHSRAILATGAQARLNFRGPDRIGTSNA